ncbi:hypothetical protein ACLKQF_09655 [Aeromonas salmonicida]
MAVARLTANLKSVMFNKTVSVKTELELKNGEKVNSFKSQNVQLGTVDINSDFSKVDGLTKDEVMRFQLWAKKQIKDVTNAYKNNLRRGLVGGYPVIKRTLADDKKYCNDFGYISGRNIGEFLGVIADPIHVEPVQNTGNGAQAITENLKSLRHDGRLSEMFEQVFFSLKEIHNNQPFTAEEKVEIFIAERQLFYLNTQGFAITQKELEARAGERAKNIYHSNRKHRVG